MLWCLNFYSLGFRVGWRVSWATIKLSQVKRCFRSLMKLSSSLRSVIDNINLIRTLSTVRSELHQCEAAHHYRL